MTFKVPEKFRLKDCGHLSSDESFGNNGVFSLHKTKTTAPLHVIASDGDGWEHVSVSLPHRCPTWEEMCHVKSLFWGEEDCVIQYHPPKKEYVNIHNYCLHLWRPNDGQEIRMPPKIMIG